MVVLILIYNNIQFRRSSKSNLGYKYTCFNNNFLQIFD